MKEITDAALDRYYAAEVCNCEPECDDASEHARKVRDAYEDYGDREYDRRREEGLL